MMKPKWDSAVRCPRCRGNLGLEYDPPGNWDVVCLQCGYRHVAVLTRGSVVDDRALFAESIQEEKAA